MAVYRTFLFAPGNHPRRVEKALSLDADAVILDLEDACPIAEKKATRAVVVAACQRPRTGLGYVRVNATSTEFGYGDIVAVVQKGVDGIVLPKVETADEIRAVDWVIANLETERGLPTGALDVIPIIETGKGMANIRAITAAGTRVKRIAFGAGDFTLDMDMEWTRAEAELLPYRSECVLASRAAGIEAPLDTVWVDLKDAEGFKASTRHIKGLGFQGKMCIHPDQVPVANDVLTPSAAEGSENVVGDGHLVGVDAHLALEPEPLDVPCRGREALGVLQVDPYGVDRGLDAGCTRGKHALAAIGQQLSLGPAPFHIHVEREIAGAEGNALDARACRRDGADVDHALAGLDDRDHVELAGGQASFLLEVGDHPVDGPDLVGHLDLRQDDAIDALLHDRDDVAIAEPAAGGVDRNIAQPRARALARGHDDGTRRLLLRDRAGILEVEDYRVRIEREAFSTRLA